jgi:hypothetical protein
LTVGTGLCVVKLLSVQPKRRKWLERYTQYQVKKIEKYIDKKDTIIVKYNNKEL